VSDVKGRGDGTRLGHKGKVVELMVARCDSMPVGFLRKRNANKPFKN
jgi:hypothetical protein